MPNTLERTNETSSTNSCRSSTRTTPESNHLRRFRRCKLPDPPSRTGRANKQESDPNEILVGTNTDVGEHVARAIGLLEVRPPLLTPTPPPDSSISSMISLRPGLTAGPKYVISCHPYQNRSSQSESFGSISWSHQVSPNSQYTRMVLI
jgi:hypothetical protein